MQSFSELEVKFSVFFFIPFAASSSFVYQPTQLGPSPRDLIDAEATGWAIPAKNAWPSVWFLSDMGNLKLEIGRGSSLASKSRIQFSETAEGLLTMKLLKPLTKLFGVGAWNLVPDATSWNLDGSVGINGRVMDGISGFSLNLAEEDIRLPESMFELLAGNSVRLEESRLIVPCGEIRFALAADGISIPIRELADLFPELADLMKAGECATNVVFDSEDVILGRSILGQYDVVLDGIRKRVVLMNKSDLRPNTTLRRFRLDLDREETYDKVSWRWKKTEANVNPGDIVFTTLRQDGSLTEFLCLRGNCLRSSFPDRESWMGSLVLNIKEDSITVSEAFRWSRYQLSIEDILGTIKMTSKVVGYRMKRDQASYKEGMHIEFHPVIGEREFGEFTVLHWPPHHDKRIMIYEENKDDAVHYLPSNKRVFGDAHFFVDAQRYRLTIEGDPDVHACDTEIRQLSWSNERFAIDFNAQICRYRQWGLQAVTYAFELLRRDQSNAEEVHIRRIKGDFNFNQGAEFRLVAASYTGDLFNPNVVWPSEPRLTYDAQRRQIIILPSGQRQWHYSHTWEKLPNGEAVLTFKATPRKLAVPMGLQLTDQVWDFVPAPEAFTGSVASIAMGRWLEEWQDGSFSLLFEQVNGPIFTGDQETVFMGVPTIALTIEGGLTVRSNGDSRYKYHVQVGAEQNGMVSVGFQPDEYTALGTYEVKVEGSDIACSICMDDFAIGDSAAETPCKHKFHKDCLRMWTEKVCPYCRGSLKLV